MVMKEASTCMKALRRHFDYDYEGDYETATDRGVRGYEFVVRTVSTVSDSYA